MGWNYEDCLQRLTERTFYGVPILSGLPILKTFSGLPSSTAEELFRVDKVNELHLQVIPLSVFVVPEVIEVHVIPSEEVRMVPPSPTTTKILLPQVACQSTFDVPEVLGTEISLTLHDGFLGIHLLASSPEVGEPLLSCPAKISYEKLSISIC